ncbi:MAG: hypothetical protein ABTQ31_07370 [Rhizobiaceae bacterium]
MLASLAAAFASGETALAVRRLRRAVVAYCLAAVFCLVGVGFLIGAAYTAVVPRYGPLYTSLFFGGGFILLALIVLLINKMTGKARRRGIGRQRRPDMTAIGVAAVAAAVPSLLQRKGSALGLVIAPVIAATAYAIYKENRKSKPDPFADQR